MVQNCGIDKEADGEKVPVDAVMGRGGGGVYGCRLVAEAPSMKK